MMEFEKVLYSPDLKMVLIFLDTKAFQKARVFSSYFFLFFKPIPIFSYFKAKTSYFSCFFFLAGEAKICNKIENGITVVCVLE